MTNRVFRDGKTGALMLAKKAFGFGFEFSAAADTVDIDGIAVVTVQGPLEHHEGFFWDSYESICERVGKALKSDETRAVVMRIDSPGGDASGTLEAHKRLRAMSAKAGKPLYAYADEAALSAAYALASAAEEIWGPPTCEIGSIGVIAGLVDRTKANAKDGIRVQLLTTGERKADTHPDRELTDDIVAAMQARVDKVGEAFFGVVAEARGMSPKAVRALQAGVFTGQDAIDAGIADGVASWEDFLAVVRSASGLAQSAERPVEARPSGSKDRTGSPTAAHTRIEMPKLLQLTKARDDAKKAMLAGKTEDERTKLLAAYEAAAAEVTKYKKTVEEEETSTDEDEEEEETEEESGDDDGGDSDDDGDEKSSTASSTSAEAAEAEKCLAGKTGLHTYPRLFRLCQQVTGQKGVDAVFGALSAIQKDRKEAPKLAARLAKLEGARTADKVDAMLKRAAREGKITTPEAQSLRAQGLKSPQWLKGHLAVKTARVHTLDEGGELPSEAARSALNASPGGGILASLTREQIRMVEMQAMTTGKTVEAVAKEILDATSAGASSPRH